MTRPAKEIVNAAIKLAERDLLLRPFVRALEKVTGFKSLKSS